MWLINSNLKLFRVSKSPIWAFSFIPPSFPAHVVTYDDANGIIFTYTNLFHLWAPCLAAVRRSETTDSCNVLWLANNMEGLWAEALQIVALTLIICAASVIACSLTSLLIGVSGWNRILHWVMTFLLDQFTLKIRKKLVLLLNYGVHKLPNKPPPMDPDFAKKSSLDS